MDIDSPPAIPEGGISQESMLIYCRLDSVGEEEIKCILNLKDVNGALSSGAGRYALAASDEALHNAVRYVNQRDIRKRVLLIQGEDGCWEFPASAGIRVGGRRGGGRGGVHGITGIRVQIVVAAGVSLDSGPEPMYCAVMPEFDFVKGLGHFAVVESVVGIIDSFTAPGAVRAGDSGGAMDELCPCCGQQKSTGQRQWQPASQLLLPCGVFMCGPQKF